METKAHSVGVPVVTGRLPEVNGKVEVLGAEEAGEHELAEQITAAAREAQETMRSGIRKVVRCGLLMLMAKKFCKYGDLGPWLAKHCPEIAESTGRRYREIISSACSHIGVFSSDTFHVSLPPLENAHCERFEFGAGKSPTHEVSLATMLLLPLEALVEPARSLHEKFWGVFEGKSQKEVQLVLRATDPLLPGWRCTQAETDAFLKCNFPKLRGQRYEELPEPVQAEARKWIATARKPTAMDELEDAEFRLQMECNHARRLLADIQRKDAKWLKSRIQTFDELKALYREIGREMDTIRTLRKP